MLFSVREKEKVRNAQERRKREIDQLGSHHSRLRSFYKAVGLWLQIASITN